ncbi:protein ENHANCED DISEASE RESISTANCE 2-like isoform X1 [Arachis ipaensis]|uniref:protein ENHANCED DISEASE RESISTANCE 2-like isoform X1 n=1 Tax=Arachis ipaensis TaxID=130454 RepID=UPI000A2B8AFC|nr:protein ENHANCED DISEASE RESISTANCE 2-like isoform X1 [Arachis ipaensis]XP_025684989.1 protein ENHANCED DISEASE RESISTANCE 2 [Arachis hypogaea]
MAVGVVDGSSEAIFQTSMSLGPSRSAWDFCFYKGSLVEHVDGHTDVIHKELYRDWLPCCCPASAISVEKEKGHFLLLSETFQLSYLKLCFINENVWVIACSSFGNGI